MVVSLLREIGFSLDSTPLLLCDNISVTYLVAHLIMHERTKHVEIDHHFVHEGIFNRQLVVKHVSSKDQIVDIMIKRLPTAQFQGLRIKLTVVNGPISLQGNVKPSSLNEII